MNNLEVIIGIEIHLELNTQSKAFSSSKVDFIAEPNTNVNSIDLGFPGSLPTLNKGVVEHAIKLSKALNMKIDNELHFDRKHYFYPDLPKGYQITQQRRPIGSNGSLKINVDGKEKEISIERIHIEEDTAKQNHNETNTTLNYNRAGVPLLEIVTDPVLKTGKEVSAYIDAIRQIARALNISDAKMEEGSLRADVNISLRPFGQKEFGTKVEIKNMNSMSNAEKAIEFEIALQTKKILSGIKIEMDTKRFDANTNSTVTMRTKTSVTDYKYFPEPNIPIIKLTDEFIDCIKIPELPAETKARLLKQNIDEKTVETLLLDLDVLNYFESIPYEDKNKLSKVFLAEIISLLNASSKNIKDLDIEPKEISEALKLVDEGIISGKHLKQIIPLLSSENKTTQEIVEEKGMKQISDDAILLPIIDKIITNNKNIIGEYANRPERVVKHILGTLMKETQGQANPIVSNKLVIEKLEGLK